MAAHLATVHIRLRQPCAYDGSGNEQDAGRNGSRRSGAGAGQADGYDEALLLYVLGQGSPTHPLPEESYAAWASTYRWERCYGQEYLYAGPLFTHQLSHVCIDFRGIQDAFMRDKGIDYFENSRRATYVQQQHAIENPLEFNDYGGVLPTLDFCIHQAHVRTLHIETRRALLRLKITDS